MALALALRLPESAPVRAMRPKSNADARAPIFVIGAQKAGTTTLTMDLAACDDLYVDLNNKEASPLLTPHHQDWYREFEAQFKGCLPHQRAVDISTRYSMAPHTNVDFRNVALWGSDSLVLYVIRKRLDRSISHHHHDTVLGLCTEPIDKALTPQSAFVTNSMYADQIDRWLEHLDASQIKIIDFDTYTQNRRATVNRICSVADVSNAGVENIEPAKAYNTTLGRPTLNAFTKRATQSVPYRALRRHIPVAYRRRALQLIGTPAPPRDRAPSEQVVERLAPLFEADQERLADMLPTDSFLRMQ